MAERALVSVLNLYRLLELVDREHFAWALAHEGTLLIECESPVDHLIIDIDLGLLSHSTGGDRGPLSVNLADTLLCDHRQLYLLVLAEHHEADRVFLVALVVFIQDRNHGRVHVNRYDMLGGHLLPISVTAAGHIHSEVDGALGTHPGAGTLLTRHKAVDLLGDERYKAESVGKKLVMKRTSVLSHLDKVDGHRWHL